MTNKTTEQDMEAESVDKNDATLIESPDSHEDTVADAADDIQQATDEAQKTQEIPETADAASSADLNAETEATEPEIPEPVAETFDDSIIAPGSLSRALKKCREEADMSLEDAAGEMHLPLPVVKALEEENFADLPDPPYVRGYLRSYARLNESDATNLINRYETLRGANPGDSASFTPATPRYQPKNKKAVSPTTIKLAGFSMIVLLMVVLSMIPAVSQWASDTWQSFSEPQNQKLAAAQKAKADAAAGNGVADTTETDTNAQATTETTQNTDMASSSSDTAMPGNTEQLAVNQESTDTDSTASTGEQDTSAEQGTTEQAAGSAATDTPAGETEQAADSATDSTEAAGEGENGAAETEQAAADDKNDPTAVDGSDASAASATETTDTETTDTETTDTDTTDTDTTDTDTTTAQESATTQEQDTATAEAETTGQEQTTEAQAAAEQAAAEKAEADKAAAAQQAATQQDDNFQQPIDGSVFIRLVFTQDVWMSIKDGRGKTIFGALNAAGTRKDLRANTPLQFKVGNAPGVQIYLNGQLIDQKPYTRGSVATFRAN